MGAAKSLSREKEWLKEEDRVAVEQCLDELEEQVVRKRTAVVDAARP